MYRCVWIISRSAQRHAGFYARADIYANARTGSRHIHRLIWVTVCRVIADRNRYTHAQKQRDRDRQTDRHGDMQAGGQAGKQRDRQTDRLTETHTHTHTHRQTDRHKARQRRRYRHQDRHTDGDRQTDTINQTDNRHLYQSTNEILQLRIYLEILISKSIFMLNLVSDIFISQIFNWFVYIAKCVYILT